MANKNQVTDQKEVTKPVITPSKRSFKSILDSAHRSATRKIATFGLITTLIGCAPSVANAKDTTPAKGKPVAAAVEKGKLPVKYISVTLADLAPYLENAEGKVLKNLEYDKYSETEHFVIVPLKAGVGSDFAIYTRDETKPSKLGVPLKGVSIGAKGLSETAVMEVPVSPDHPFIKDAIIIVASNEIVFGNYINKQTGEPSVFVVDLSDGNIPPGPIRIGEGKDDSGIFFIVSPQNLKPGTPLAQAMLFNDGSGGPGWFILEESSRVAMK